MVIFTIVGCLPLVQRWNGYLPSLNSSLHACLTRSLAESLKHLQKLGSSENSSGLLGNNCWCESASTSHSVFEQVYMPGPVFARPQTHILTKSAILILFGHQTQNETGQKRQFWNMATTEWFDWKITLRRRMVIEAWLVVEDCWCTQAQFVKWCHPSLQQATYPWLLLKTSAFKFICISWNSFLNYCPKVFRF